MLVHNNFLHDSRVLKEAETLLQQGWKVAVVAVRSPEELPSEEERESGLRVVRVKVDPLHVRILGWVRRSPRPKRRGPGFSRRLLSPVLRRWLSLVARAAALRQRLVDAAIDEKERLDREGLTLFGVLRALPIGVVYYLIRLYSLLLRWFRRWVWRTLRLGFAYLRRLVRRGRRLVVLGTAAARRTLYQTLRVLFMPYHRQLAYLDYYRQALRLGEAADVYHAHDLNVLPVAWWLARRDGARLVYDSHELYLDRNRLEKTSRLGRWYRGRIESFLIRRSDAVITVNEAIAQELARRYRVPEPAVVMNAPVSRAPESGEGPSLRRELELPDDRVLLLYSGGITFNRGLENVLEALASLPSCHLVFLGYGASDFVAGLRQMAAERGIEHRVTFFGAVPPGEVTRWAAGADIGLAPIENACLSYYLCSPNKLFEYLHAGLPVAASDFPELRRVVEKFDVGVTFDPADPADICRAIRTLLEDRDRLAERRENTRAAAAVYNWERESAKLEKIYAELP